MPGTKDNSYPKDFLEKIKKMLLDEKGNLEKELAKMTGGRNTEDSSETTFPDYGDKDDENAAEVADYAANLSLEGSLDKSLRDVNQSLQRLSKGIYGICKYCKKPIDQKRLLARPTSSACVSCKKTIIQEV